MRVSLLLVAATAAAEQCTDQDAHYRAMATLDRHAETEQSAPNPCDAHIDPRWLAAVKSFIRTRQVAVFGVERSPGLQQVHDRLRDLGACWDFWDLWQPEVIGYLRCMHSEQSGTYVFLNGVLAGNGMKFAGSDVTDEQLKASLRGAHAQFECGSPEKCEHLAPAAEIERAEALRRTKPVILFGWEGCPCTRMGQARLHEAGACFHIELWRTPNAPLLRYYQCIYGMDDHSFVWIGNKHIGTGFALHPSRMPQAALNTQLRDAGALTDCVTPHRYHQQLVAAKQECPAGFAGTFPDCERITAAPSPLPPPTCDNTAEWVNDASHHGYYRNYGCKDFESYGERSCDRWGHLFPSRLDGRVANQACCFCVNYKSRQQQQAAASGKATEAKAATEAVASDSAVAKAVGTDHVVVTLPVQSVDPKTHQATLEKEEKKDHTMCWLTMGGLVTCIVGLIAFVVRRCCCKKVIVKDVVKGVEVVEGVEVVQLAEKTVETLERRGDAPDSPSTPGASNEDKSSPSSSKSPYSASLPSEPALLAD